MEATCTICKHYSNTLEKHERHNQSAEHLRNMEIYNLGMEHGQYKAAARLAAAEELAKCLRACRNLLRVGGYDDIGGAVKATIDSADTALAKWQEANQ